MQPVPHGYPTRLQWLRVWFSGRIIIQIRGLCVPGQKARKLEKESPIFLLFDTFTTFQVYFKVAARFEKDMRQMKKLSVLLTNNLSDVDTSNIHDFGD